MNSENDEKDIYDRVSSNLLFKITFAAIAIIGAIVTIYAAFFQEKEVKVQYIISANSNVLDINANINKVDILYDSTSLKQSDNNLRIYNIKVANNGDADVLKTFFDENEPLGIEIQNGEIIEKPEITETSSSYLKNNLKVSYKNHSKVEFSRVILESDEFFSFKLLVLHKNSVVPKLIPLGKIAGQKEIEIINSSEVRVERPFLLETFGGNIWVQLTRLVAYFIIIVLIIIIIVSSSEKIDNIRASKKRKKNIKKFKANSNYSHNKMNDAIFSRYDQFGSRELMLMNVLTDDENVLTKKYKKGVKRVKNKKDVTTDPDFVLSKRFNQIDYDLGTINSMIHDGLVIKDGEKLNVNNPMKFCLNSFIEFLKERKELSNRFPYFDTSDLDEEDDFEEQEIL